MTQSAVSARSISADARANVETRLAAVHRFWQRGVADLTLDQVNHAERAGVLSIAFTLLHAVGNEDRSGELYLDAGPTLWAAGWRDRTGVGIDLIGRGTPMDVAERIRIGDLDVWREYQSAVFARTERAVASLSVTRLEAPAFATPRKLDETSFLHSLVGDRTPRVVDVIEAFLCSHLTRHLGELEHARALVGLSGLT